MRANLATVIFCLLTFSLWAQVPQGFKYQAVARDASGQVLSEKNISIRIGILVGNTTGKLAYREEHSVVSNKFGLFDLVIGKGKPDSGVFSEIDWPSGDHFVSVEIDPNGGNDFILMGTSQLLSVPYSLHAQTVEIDKVDDADHDPENEIQFLSLTNNNLQLSKGGGSVTLPSSGTNLWKSSASGIYYNSGLVGIGTASPTSLLTLDGGNSNGEIRLFNTSSGNRQILDGLTLGISSSSSYDSWFWNRENGKIMFGTNNTERVTITADGKVGIGITNPIKDLDIKGTTQIDGSLEVKKGLKVYDPNFESLDIPHESNINYTTFVGTPTIGGILKFTGTTDGSGIIKIPFPEDGFGGEICIINVEVYCRISTYNQGYRSIKDGIWYEIFTDRIEIYYPDKTEYSYENWRMTAMIYK